MKPSPELVSVLGISDGGIHLQASSFSQDILIIEGQVLRKCFGGDKVVRTPPEPTHFSGRGQVKNMKPVSVLLGCCDCTLCRQQSSLVVSPFCMCGDVHAISEHRGTGPKAILILCMNSD
jgi:hypothetical protein